MTKKNEIKAPAKSIATDKTTKDSKIININENLDKILNKSLSENSNNNSNNSNNNINKKLNNNYNINKNSNVGGGIAKLKLWHKVLIGMLLGSIFGYFFKDYGIMLKPVGIIFINTIKMVVVPLIFFSVLYGITSIDDAHTLGRLGVKAFILYTMTTVLAITIGLVFANIFKPGVGLNIQLTDSSGAEHHTSSDIVTILVNIIPSNPIEAMATGNTLQVVIFALFVGISLILVGEKGRVVKEFIISGTHIIFKMVEIVIKFTPYGVFAIMAWVSGSYGLDIIFGLTKFILVVLGALLLQYVIFGLILIFLGRLNPLPFYKKMRVIQALAFATSSSKATLPTAIMELTGKMGVSKKTASFILPLGASMNMDGVAIYLGICAVFFAQIIGVELTHSQYLVLILTATIGSIGAAGFPGGSMVMMGMVLSSVGLPLEGISLIIGIDRFLEMIRTVINITGDCTITVVVDKIEGTLNKKEYYK